MNHDRQPLTFDDVEALLQPLRNRIATLEANERATDREIGELRAEIVMLKARPHLLHVSAKAVKAVQEQFDADELKRTEREPVSFEPPRLLPKAGNDPTL
jgi:phage shock protein A